MVTFNEIQAQLVALDPRFRFMGISEVRKLARLLDPNEQIFECMKGWHKGRATLLCATDKKILYIDVRSVERTLPHIEYSNIKKIYLHQSGMLKSVFIHTNAEVVEFMVLRKKNAKALKVTIERHITYINNALAFSGRLDTKAAPTRHTYKTWRSLVKKMGSASITS